MNTVTYEINFITSVIEKISYVFSMEITAISLTFTETD
jgi:hypothetical protein